MAKEQITELSVTMLFWSREQQVCVQTKDTKYSDFVVPTHLTTIHYPADLHADFPKRISVDHVAAVRHKYSVSLLQLFIAERTMQWVSPI